MKTIIAFLSLFFLFASSTKFSTAVTDDGDGNLPLWSNPSNAQAEDGIVASDSAKDDNTRFLKVVGFGFSIPAGSTIDSIYDSVKCMVGVGDCDLDASAAYKNGTLLPGDFSTGEFTSIGTLRWQAAYDFNIHKYGVSWTADDINHAGTGFRVSFLNQANIDSLSVDAFKRTVVYTTSSGVRHRATRFCGE